MRLMIRLAAERGHGSLTVAELAEKEALPEPTVGKLLNRLKTTRLVDSVRGRGGGFELARAPERITVSDVLTALGQPALGGNACTDGAEDTGRCPHLRRCNLRPVWSHLEGLISQVFERTTIADLLKQERRVREHLSQLTDHGIAAAAAVSRERETAPREIAAETPGTGTAGAAG